MKIAPNVPVVGGSDQSSFIAGLPVSDSTQIALYSHSTERLDAEREGNRQPEREARREPTAKLLAVRLTVGLGLIRNVLLPQKLY